MRISCFLVAFACSAPSTTTVPTPPKWIADTAVPTPPPDVAPSFRLPGDVRPVRVDLDLTIIPAEPQASGKVHVDARVVRPTSVVWLHASGLTITRAALNSLPVKTVQRGELLGLLAPKELPAGSLAIDIAFTAGIEKVRSRGVYSEKEGEESYAYTFFEATDARRAFPCFDEPAYKVPWKLTFHVRKDHVALANTPVTSEVDEPGGMKRVETAETKPLPSYLVAFIVGPFELVDGGVGGRAKTPIRFAIPKGRGGELGWAKQVTPKVVAALETYFDMDYPFGKLDVAVVPRFWGTMEHPGLVAMGQPLTLIRPGEETRQRKVAYANILAHELGHYWFGDLVTMSWWEDTWLNEALTMWVDVIITDATEPAWRYRDLRVNTSMSAMRADETLSTRSIRQPVTTPEGIQASFDNAITYDKGASLFRMFEASVGEAKWRDFIRTYVRKHAWGNASADDFLGVAKAQLGAPVEAGLRSFLEQPGVPRISITCADKAPPELTIKQTRSLPAGTVDPATKLWNLPVCLRLGTATKASSRCFQLSTAESTEPIEWPARPVVGRADPAFAGCPTWIIPNENAMGYYRSVVDPATALALLTPTSAIAKTAKPTVAEKLMLVADLRAAVERDELTIDKVLALAAPLATDANDRVAMAAFEAGGFRADVLDDALYAKVPAFAIKTYGPMARKLGWKRGAADSDDRHERRQMLMIVVARHDAALARQVDPLFEQWIAKRTGIEDDLVSTMLAIALQRGGAPRFDQILDAARKPRDRAEKDRLLSALGQSRDVALARRAFELVRSKEFDLRDSIGIVYGVLFTRETRAVGFELVKTHLDELLARMRDDEAAGFLGALAGGSCDASLRKQIADLVMPRAAKVDGAKAAVDRGLEQTDQCIASTARQLPALRKFLSTY